MTEWSKISGILDEIRQQESILEVSLVSRGGMYIMGDTPQGAHQETFAAMSAIIMGAAETTSSELKDLLGSVVISLSERNLILASAGPKYMLAIAVSPDGNVNDILDGCRDKITQIERSI